MLELSMDIRNRLKFLFARGFKIKQEIDDTGYDKQTVVLESPDCEIIIDRIRGSYDVTIKSLVPEVSLHYPLNIFEAYFAKKDLRLLDETRGYYAFYKDLQQVATKLMENIDKIIELFKNEKHREIAKDLDEIVREFRKMSS